MAAVDAKIKLLTSFPTVYYELDATDLTKRPDTAGPGTFVDLLISRAGGNNVGKSLKSHWAQISLEQLVVANPPLSSWESRPMGPPPIRSSRAPVGKGGRCQNGQIYPFDDNLVSRPGPRLVDGLEALAKLLHPDFFT